jgi:hypothetical protein
LYVNFFPLLLVESNSNFLLVKFLVGLPFSEKNTIPRNSEQVGTDGSSVGIPPVSRKRKTSEFHSEPFLGRENSSEFCSESFLDVKNLGILFRVFFGTEKTSEFRSE